MVLLSIRRSPNEIAEKIFLFTENESQRKSLGDNGRKLYEMNYTLMVHAEALDYAIDLFIEFLKKFKKVNIERLLKITGSVLIGTKLKT